MYCQVLTAYARECERAGVRIPSWREETGCRNDDVPHGYGYWVPGTDKSTIMA